MAIDTADFYLNWVNTEAVMYFSKGVRPRSVKIAVARRKALTRKIAQTLGIEITSHQMLWNLPVALMDGLTPGPNDVIQDASGVRWIVNGDAEYLGDGSRWRVLTTKER